MSAQNVKKPEEKEIFRLSTEDRAYLEKRQVAYEEALDFYRSVYEKWLEKKNRKDADCFNDSFEVIAARNIDDWIYAEVEDVQWEFVLQIYEYFSNKYYVRLDHRIKPKSFPCIGKKTEEQIREKLRSRSFMTVVSDIFDQTEGTSFENMPIHQLKKRMRAACMVGDGTRCRVNVKNNTLQYYGDSMLEIFVGKYDCDEPFINELPDALSVFLYGEIKRLPGCDFLYPGHRLRLTSYEIKTGFDADQLEKVERIKFFKNGRIDIKFDTKANAMAFAREWCGFPGR